MANQFSYTVKPEDKTLSIKELLRRRFTFSSRMMTRLKKNESILLNGQQVKLYVIPKEGDLIEIGLPEEQSYFLPQPVPVIPVYEDEDLLIIDKPPGYVVHPTNGHPVNTMANGIAKYILDTEKSFKIRFVNRLDMDTSGLLVIAKNPHCQAALIKQMTQNKVVKKYQAVVAGLVETDRGTINLPIGRPDPEKPHRGVVEDGYPSVTHYTVLQRFPAGYTLVELLLQTGRTHQIRVHMSYMGHPIVGDHLYGGENVLLIERQALHASSFSFHHPVTGIFTEVTTPLPDDICELIEKIKPTQ